MCFYLDMDGGDFEFPTLVQDELQHSFNVEKRELESKIAELQTEKENSQAAFDKYRERARLSLMKSATDGQQSENDLAMARAELKVGWCGRMSNALD